MKLAPDCTETSRLLSSLLLESTCDYASLQDKDTQTKFAPPSFGKPLPPWSMTSNQHQAQSCAGGSLAEWPPARTALSEEVEQIRQENALSIVREWAKKQKVP